MAAPLDPARVRALGRIGEMASQAERPWWIIGSAAMALHGADPGTVRDIDILMHPADAERLFGERLARAVPVPPSARFRSDLFARWDEGGMAVELMAGFHVREGSGWRPVVPAVREEVRLGGCTLFTPGIPGLIALCNLFGRRKDLERKRLLEAL